eukprot:2284042-Lingulodinium_polyedra.AAC.1
MHLLLKRALRPLQSRGLGVGTREFAWEVGRRRLHLSQRRFVPWALPGETHLGEPKGKLLVRDVAVAL